MKRRRLVQFAVVGCMLVLWGGVFSVVDVTSVANANAKARACAHLYGKVAVAECEGVKPLVVTKVIKVDVPHVVVRYRYRSYSPPTWEQAVVYCHTLVNDERTTEGKIITNTNAGTSGTPIPRVPSYAADYGACIDDAVAAANGGSGVTSTLSQYQVLGK